MIDKFDIDMLNKAFKHAQERSGCCKVAVGCVIYNPTTHNKTFGANRAIPNLCKTNSCLRVEKYGDDSKNHRNPEDCRAIHSEIDAISRAARYGTTTHMATAYVTRYPCEACAKALVGAGISRVVYGGTATISEQTKEILQTVGTEVEFADGWREDHSDR